MYKGIITENRLDDWVRGNSEKAQGVIVELIERLVAASTPYPKERRFPLGDSIGQSGPDGILDTDSGYPPFIPIGKSIWEIGTNDKPQNKATSDYNSRTQSESVGARKNTCLILVTPLSGRRGWSSDSQNKWLSKKRKRKEWKNVHIIDGTKLVDWLHYFPSVLLWLAGELGHLPNDLQTPEQQWEILKKIGYPPHLIPDVFLVNRDEACTKMKEVISGHINQLQIDTHYPNQIIDFVAAYLENIDTETRNNTLGRCLIISSEKEWNNVVSLLDKHILIAGFDLNSNDSETIILQKAHNKGHSVIYAGSPGGFQYPYRVSLKNPREGHIKDALMKAGYKEQIAHTLAQRTGGNIDDLLCILQKLSLTPEWAQESSASELYILELIGGFDENKDADKAIVEKLSKKVYGEWIEQIRNIALHPGTPLSHRNGAWKFNARYKGWYALGPRIFNEHLDLFKEICINVLKEQDPQFELPPQERFMANIRGKVFTHSQLLRNGLSESLALLGSHPKALSSCSIGQAEFIASITIRELLDDSNWVLWASLNDKLPLLAEASPNDFLEMVEKALNSDYCPFDTLFTKEEDGLFGCNYMTGLLWALETLAWGADYLIRVVSILGKLASKDPGGKSANRPLNSLATILSPWMPQTCASIQKRITSVEILINEYPDVGWELLLLLIPKYSMVSNGTRKPAWREIIPDTWSDSITYQELWEQNIAYSNLAIKVSKQAYSKLVILTKRIVDLPQPSRNHLLDYLGTDEIVSLPDTERNVLWTILVDIVSKHRKYANTEWALKPDEVNDIDKTVTLLASNNPSYIYKQLFSDHDFDLYEENGDWDEQQKILESKRKIAINEIFLFGGWKAVLEFTKSIESAWKVGFAFGGIAKRNDDVNVLPDLLESEQKSLAQFAGSYVKKRFIDLGWQWVDELDTSKWAPSQIGQLLAYLPFDIETWNRVSKLLGENESQYWVKTSAHPYETKENLYWAIDRLIQYGRLDAALSCLDLLKHGNREINLQQAIRVLQEIQNTPDMIKGLNIHAITNIIKALQNDPKTNQDDLFQIEWTYLPLLDRHSGAYPKLLEQRLSEDPAMFCEVIQTVYRSKKEKNTAIELTEQQKNIVKNAYRLLKEWKLPPGSQKDKTINGEALSKWLESVKNLAEQSGHLEVALSRVGQVFRYAPPDSDGLWIDHNVADILNAKDADVIRQGFCIELQNSRGVYYGSGGKSERQLAKDYRIKAEEVENRGYHRLANSLRSLAKSYDHEAEREETEDLYDN